MSRERRGKKLKPRIFFLVEGKTEKIFFDMLAQKYRLTGARTVRVLDCQGNDFVDKAKNKLKNSRLKPDKKTKVFIVFDNDGKLSDTDSEGKNNIHNLFKKAQQIEGIESCSLVISNYCFEVWLLAHFKTMTAGFKNLTSLKKELSQFLGETYVKGNSSQIEKILNDDRVLKAIKNTNTISSIKCEEQSTNIGVIVQDIIK